MLYEYSLSAYKVMDQLWKIYHLIFKAKVHILTHSRCSVKKRKSVFKRYSEGRSSLALSVPLRMAPISAPLTPESSITFSPCIVVPPGDATEVRICEATGHVTGRR